MALNKKLFKRLKKEQERNTNESLKLARDRIKVALAACPSPTNFQRYINLCDKLKEPVEL